MKRCAFCGGRLGLGVRFRNPWKGMEVAGAGEGNRTLVCSLGKSRSGLKSLMFWRLLHPVCTRFWGFFGGALRGAMEHRETCAAWNRSPYRDPIFNVGVRVWVQPKK